MKSEFLSFFNELKNVDCKPNIVQLSIDGLMYTSAKIPADLGFPLLAKLGALLGPGFLQYLSTSEEDAEMDGILRVIERASMMDTVGLVKELLQNMQCNKLSTSGDSGKVNSDFGAHFAGEYLHMMKVAVFAVAHNMRGFTRGAN